MSRCEICLAGFLELRAEKLLAGGRRGIENCRLALPLVLPRAVEGK